MMKFNLVHQIQTLLYLILLYSWKSNIVVLGDDVVPKPSKEPDDMLKHDVVDSPTASDSSSSSSDTIDHQLRIYQKLLFSKRSSQIEAVKYLVQMDDYAKQYKMIQMLLDRMFVVLKDSKVLLTSSDFVPGSSRFPAEAENEKLRDGLSNLFENVLFFADIVLHIPDMTHQIFDKMKEWKEIINWSLTFSKESGFLDKKNMEVVNLMAQELSLVQKDPDFKNPYKAEYQQRQLALQKAREEASSKTKKKKRKDRPKGPRLSSAKQEL